MESKITKTTELSPSVIIKNRKGKLYKIETYHDDKNTYKISPWPIKSGEENPSYVIITRDTLINKEWEKMDKDKIKLEELLAVETENETEGNSEESEGASLFIKEDKQNKEESIDF